VPKTLAERVTDLEKTIEPLRELPARVTRLELRVAAVEEQVVQLRGEMRDGFSAILDVIEAGSAATVRLLEETRTAIGAEIRGEMTAFRAEIRDEMTAFRAEIGGEMTAFRAEIGGEMTAFRAEIGGEMTAFRAEICGEMTAFRAEVGGEVVALRSATSDGLGSVRREMRVLHEDLIERIARIGEGSQSRRKRRQSKN
jgi:hypothetical protein